MPRLLDCSCAVAEYRGTSWLEPERVVLNYGRSRALTRKGNYAKSPHTFVVMVVTEGTCEGLKEFVRKKKLGKVWETNYLTNINHSGNWNIKNYGGNSCKVVVYAPDHEALTKWIQKTDANYSL